MSSDHPRVRIVNWRPRLIISVALGLILAVQEWLGVYWVEEALTVLLGIALVLIPLLLIVIALLLLWHGSSRVFLWMKGMLDRITGIRERTLRPDQAMSHPFPRH